MEWRREGRLVGIGRNLTCYKCVVKVLRRADEPLPWAFIVTEVVRILRAERPSLMACKDRDRSRITS